MFSSGGSLRPVGQYVLHEYTDPPSVDIARFCRWERDEVSHDLRQGADLARGSAAADLDLSGLASWTGQRHGVADDHAEPVRSFSSPAGDLGIYLRPVT